MLGTRTTFKSLLVPDSLCHYGTLARRGVSGRRRLHVVVVTDGAVRIVDYKTDRGRHAESEYRVQLSVYHHVVAAEYPDREVTASVFYTANDESVELEPVSLTTIEGLVAGTLAGDPDERSGTVSRSSTDPNR